MAIISETQSTNKRLLSLPEVEMMVGLSKPTIYRNISNGTFPRPLKVSARRVAWDLVTVNEWIATLGCTSKGGQ